MSCSSNSILTNKNTINAKNIYKSIKIKTKEKTSCYERFKKHFILKEVYEEWENVEKQENVNDYVSLLLINYIENKRKERKKLFYIF